MFLSPSPQTSTASKKPKSFYNTNTMTIKRSQSMYCSLNIHAHSTSLNEQDSVQMRKITPVKEHGRSGLFDIRVDQTGRAPAADEARIRRSPSLLEMNSRREQSRSNIVPTSNQNLSSAQNSDLFIRKRTVRFDPIIKIFHI